MTSGELVSHWLASALSNERGFSVLNRPQVAQHVALNADAVPNAQALPKEEVTASLTLNQVNAIDEKAQNFEGDGELVSTVCVREGDSIYDYCWFPRMNSDEPASSTSAAQRTRS